MPYGVGFKYNFSGKWNFIADIGYRHPYTDYLDDVSGNYPKNQINRSHCTGLSDRSGETTGVYIGAPGTQRGDLRPHDTYWFIGLNISFTIFQVSATTKHYSLLRYRRWI